MTRYRVIGPRRVAGVDPGGIADLAELDDSQIAALVAAGHIAPRGKRTGRGEKAGH